jgi:hypothetical protein
MPNEDKLSRANDQLTRVLAFFPRLDAKMSVVLAIDTGMLAFLATHAPPPKDLTAAEVIVVGVAILLLGANLWFLYRGGAPHLKGGEQSLVYFREIASRTEAKYIDEFLGTDDATYTKDVLGQVWRNSEILKNKFDHLQAALVCLALAIVPWVAALVMFAAHSRVAGPA